MSIPTNVFVGPAHGDGSKPAPHCTTSPAASTATAQVSPSCTSRQAIPSSGRRAWGNGTFDDFPMGAATPCSFEPHAKNDRRGNRCSVVGGAWKSVSASKGLASAQPPTVTTVATAIRGTKRRSVGCPEAARAHAARAPRANMRPRRCTSPRGTPRRGRPGADVGWSHDVKTTSSPVGSAFAALVCGCSLRRGEILFEFRPWLLGLTE